MIIYFASGNAHKKHELEQLIPRITLKIPEDKGIPFVPDENGNSFAENAWIKAKALWEIVKAPVLADDSGLCVDLLGGAPGIYSARYGGAVPQSEKNRLLLEEVAAALSLKRNHRGVAAVNHENPRSCRFVCALILFLSPSRFFIVQETLEGALVQSLEHARGSGGFGYDPIVIPQGYSKTVAELGEEEKNRISHRGKAAFSLDKIIFGLYGMNTV
jgi:XTP/dITP diphosphohydrolase